MKKFTFLLLLIPSYVLGSLPHSKTAPLLDHLTEVNQQWGHIDQVPGINLCIELDFNSDEDRIEKHLQIVEVFLRNATNKKLPSGQLTHRNNLLEILAKYRQAKCFPQNHYHTSRQPYFIDNHGTPCAVGHLMIKSGFVDLAHKIARENNYAYILDLKNEEVYRWANDHGFTISELALIQPGYGPQYQWSSLGNGSDGNVTCLYSDETHNRLIIAGNFSTLDGDSVNQIGYYQNGSFFTFGQGVEGNITSIAVLGQDVYLGGLFSDSSNIAKWDGIQWNYFSIVPGKVHALEIYNGELVAGGDFSGKNASGEKINFIARLEGTEWEPMGNISGPVNCIAIHMGELYIGGTLNINPSPFSPQYMAVYRKNGPFWYWYAPTSHLNRLHFPASSITSDGIYLYAVGPCKENNNPALCISRLGNSGWEDLIYTTAETYEGLGFTQVFSYSNEVYIIGDFFFRPGLSGTYGGGVAKLNSDRIYPNMELMAVLDSTASAITVFNGSLVVGGKFSNMSHLAKTDFLTSNEFPLSASVKLSPNPAVHEVWGSVSQGAHISEVNVYDLKGQNTMSIATVIGNRFTLNLERLAPGMYFVETKTKDGALGKTKLLVK